MRLRQFPANPGNHSSGRANTIVDTITVHTTQGTAEGAAAWFADPTSKVSAHYIVTQDGQVIQCVAEGDAAWHAGNWGVNARSIGVEVEGNDLSPSMWSETVIETLIQLLTEISARHIVSPVRAIPGICGHDDVPDQKPDHHTDPGPYCPWDRILREVALRLVTPVAEDPIA